MSGFLDRLQALPHVEIVHVDEATEVKAWRWPRARGEREYSIREALRSMATSMPLASSKCEQADRPGNLQNRLRIDGTNVGRRRDAYRSPARYLLW